MAITNTYYTHSVSSGTGTTKTFSIAVPSGSNQILLVSFATNDGDRAASFTSVTFGGSAMTLLDSTVISGAIGVVTYYLVNPTAGTADVVWTNSSTWTGGVYFSTVFAGVDQTTPILQNAETAGNWVNAAGSVVSFTSVTDAVAYDVAATYYTSAVTVNGSATKLSSGVHDGVVQGMTAHSEAAASSIGWSGWGTNEYKFASNVAVLNPVASAASTTVAATTTTPAFSGSAQVSPEASITVTTASPTFSGGASSGTAEATITATTESPAFSGSATGDTSQGTLTLPVMKNNTGTILANETGATVHVYEVSTGNKVVTKTAQTTNGSGVMTVSDALIVAATQYRVVVVLGSGAEGLDKVTAA